MIVKLIIFFDKSKSPGSNIYIRILNRELKHSKNLVFTREIETLIVYRFVIIICVDVLEHGLEHGVRV